MGFTALSQRVQELSGLDRRKMHCCDVEDTPASKVVSNLASSDMSG